MSGLKFHGGKKISWFLTFSISKAERRYEIRNQYLVSPVTVIGSDVRNRWRALGRADGADVLGAP